MQEDLAGQIYIFDKPEQDLGFPETAPFSLSQELLTTIEGMSFVAGRRLDDHRKKLIEMGIPEEYVKSHTTDEQLITLTGLAVQIKRHITE